MLDAIGIACKSIDKSIDFYSRFGISFKMLGDGHYEGTTKSGLRVMLDSFELLRQINPDWKEPKDPGIDIVPKLLCESSLKVDIVPKLLCESSLKVRNVCL